MITATQLATSVITISLLVGYASVASAYELLGWDWGFQVKPMEGRLVFCGKGAPSGASQVIRNAAAKWTYSKFRFTFSLDGCSNNPSANYIEFGALDDPTKTAESSTPNEPGTKRMKKCAIRFNAAKSWNAGTGTPLPTQNDLFSVALHEFGHCLGLADVPASGVVMSGLLKPGQMLRDLTPDDIAGRNKIYGAP